MRSLSGRSFGGMKVPRRRFWILVVGSTLALAACAPTASPVASTTARAAGTTAFTDGSEIPGSSITTTSAEPATTSTQVPGAEPGGSYPESWLLALIDAANTNDFDQLDTFAFASEAKRDLFRAVVESDLPVLEVMGPCETDNGSLDVDATRWGCPASFDPMQTYWVRLSKVDQEYADIEVRPVLSDTVPDGSYGSGCAPGPGPLPDGLWFGFVAARHPDNIDFDLACLFPDPEVDTRIVNESTTVRSVPVGRDVLVTELIPPDPVSGGTTYRNWEAAFCPMAGSCPVWVRILHGKVIYIAEQFFS